MVIQVLNMFPNGIKHLSEEMVNKVKTLAVVADFVNLNHLKPTGGDLRQTRGFNITSPKRFSH